MGDNHSQGGSWRSINAPPTEAGRQSTGWNEPSFLAPPLYDPSGRHASVDQSSGPPEGGASGQSMYFDEGLPHSTTPSRHRESEDSADDSDAGWKITDPKERRLWQNRLASRRSRQRRKERDESMATEISNLKSQLEEERKTNEQLRAEIDRLNTLINSLSTTQPTDTDLSVASQPQERDTSSTQNSYSQTFLSTVLGQNATPPEPST
ncbi:hypothetical protein L204_104837 [Cryptococcus depauperatus]|nr:hypothetical protein L204_05347 [Cryptococcus depauperatus CBS 7855]